MITAVLLINRALNQAIRFVLVGLILMGGGWQTLAWSQQPEGRVQDRPPEAPEGASVVEEAYLDLLEIERDENWLGREVRRYRTFPHLDRAFRYIDAGKLEEARRELESYLSIDPKDLRVRMNYLVLLHRLEDSSGVTGQAGLILQAQPGFHPVLLYRGMAYQALGERDRARLDFKRAAGSSQLTAQDELFALQMWAYLGVQSGDHAGALEALDRLVERHSDFDTHFRRGLALQQLGRPAEAQAAFLRARSLADQPQERLQVYRAILQVALEREDWETARESASSIIWMDPLDQGAIHTLAEIGSSEEDHRTTVESIEKALQVSTDPAGREFLALTLVDLGQYEAASQQLQALLEELDDPADRRRLHRSLGNLYVRQRNFSQAEAAFRHLVAIEADGPALSALAQVLEARGRLQEAIHFLGQALKVEPSATNHHRLGLLFAQLEDHSAAANHLEAALAGRITAEQRLTALAQLGFSYHAMGLYPKAREALENALSASPGKREIRAALAETLSAQGRLPEAADLLEGLVQEEPSQKTHAGLGSLYARMEEPEKAVFHLERALTLGPGPKEEAALYRELGFLHHDLQNFVEARQALERSRDLNPTDASLYFALGEIAGRQGAHRDAIEYFHLGLTLEESSDARRGLAWAFVEAGEAQEALAIYNKMLRELPEQSPAALEISAVTANLEFRQGNYLEAADLYLKAFENAPSAAPHLLVQAAESLRMAEEGEKAVEVYRRLLTVDGVSAQLRSDTLVNLGFLYESLKRYPEAVEAFKNAIDEGREDWEIHQSLGLALLDLEERQAAVDHFRRSLELKSTPQTLLYLGRSYQSLGRSGLSVLYMEKALAEREDLERVQVRDAYRDLGYLYAGQGAYERAAGAWTEAQQIEYDPAIAVSLGRVLRVLGQFDRAGEMLLAIEPDQLSVALQADRLEVLSEIRQEERQFEQAAELLFQAQSLKETAGRHYRLGLLYRRLGRTQEARLHLQKAVAAEPQNYRYMEALGYTEREAGNFEEAAALLETVVENEPDFLEVFKDLGYIHMRRADNRKAVQRFRQAIDNTELDPPRSREEEESRDHELFRLRTEISKLTNPIDVTTYLSFRTGQLPEGPTPVGLTGGALPSQGGVEVAFQPPVLGFRDERVFQIFSRVLWNVAPRSLDFDRESYQGGLGLRYKPLRTQNLFVSAEKLFRIGEQADDNWLLRGLHSWNRGFERQSQKRAWPYTSFYSDVGYFLNRPGTWVYYGEMRQGVTLNANQKILVTPHLVLDGRVMDPHQINSSYLEGGGGVSLRFLLGEGRYRHSRASFELLTQYKGGRYFRQPAETPDSTFRGWVITGVFHF